MKARGKSRLVGTSPLDNPKDCDAALKGRDTHPQYRALSGLKCPF